MKAECLFSKIQHHTSLKYIGVSGTDTVICLTSAPVGHVVSDDCKKL